MHSFYTKVSSTTRFDTKISKALSQEILKNTRRLKSIRTSNSIVTELQKTDQFGRAIQSLQVSNLNPQQKPPSYRKQKSSLATYDKILDKIGKVSRQNSIGLSEIEKNQKKVKHKIQSLEIFDVITEEEQKDYLKNYTQSIKANLFTLKKNGIKFRRESIRKSFLGAKSQRLIK